MQYNKQHLIKFSNEIKDYDKEGILFMKDSSNDKSYYAILFKSKLDEPIARVFKLYGNLLFYFEALANGSYSGGIDLSKYSKQLCGCIVLENFRILLTDCNRSASVINKYPFLIEFSDGNQQLLAAESDLERTDWIQKLQISSYTVLDKQIKYLRNEIKNYSNGSFNSTEFENKEKLNDDTDLINDENYLSESIETAISCDHIILTEATKLSFGQLNLLISIQYKVNEHNDEFWIDYAKTEVIESNLNPKFQSTILFYRDLKSDILIRFNLLNVSLKDKQKNSKWIGYTDIKLNTIFETKKFRIPLLSTDDNDDTPIGFITIDSFQSINSNYVENDYLLKNWLCNSITKSFQFNILEGHSVIQSEKQQNCSTSGEVIEDDENEFQKENNLIVASNDFNTKKFELIPECSKLKALNNETEIVNDFISVHEVMSEFKFCLKIPLEFLKSLIRQELEIVKNLLILGELNEEWNKMQLNLIQEHIEYVKIYLNSLDNLKNYEKSSEVCFKKSSDKNLKSLEFLPINLHLQRMYAKGNLQKIWKVYDFITVGAFTLHVGGQHKSGGLMKLLQHSEYQKLNVSFENCRNKLEKLEEFSLEIKSILNDIHENHSYFSNSSETNDRSSLKFNSNELVVKSKFLLNLINRNEIKNKMEFLNENRTGFSSEKFSEKLLEFGLDFDSFKIDIYDNMDYNPNNAEMIVIPENILLNTNKLIETLDEIKKLSNTNTCSDIESVIQKLFDITQDYKKLIKIIFSIDYLHENLDVIKTRLDISYRKNVCLSQILSAVINGLIIKFCSDSLFLEDIKLSGNCLIYFQGLLSLYGNEFEMWTDMAGVIKLLSSMKFQVSSNNKIFQDTNNKNLINIPIGNINESFEFKICPIFFNIGVNETANLANAFGYSKEQYELNLVYFKKLKEFCLTTLNVDKYEEIQTYLKELEEECNLVNLSTKSIRIFEIASNICKKLNGLRFTSCKSAKDRTGMAVTLEEFQILKSEYNIENDLKILNSLRSNGTRMDNVFKNIGKTLYAFNIIQLATLPVLYRPPSYICGKAET